MIYFKVSFLHNTYSRNFFVNLHVIYYFRLYTLLKKGFILFCVCVWLKFMSYNLNRYRKSLSDKFNHFITRLKSIFYTIICCKLTMYIVRCSSLVFKDRLKKTQLSLYREKTYIQMCHDVYTSLSQIQATFAKKVLF